MRYILFFSALFCMALVVDNTYRTTPNTSFGIGEELRYRVHYGILNAAEANMIISDKLYNINGRPCYKIDIYGKSVGIFAMMMHLKDNWGTYVDTTSIIPHRFYRYIEEGKYRKKEIVNFDHVQNIAITNKYDKHTKEYTGSLTHEVPDNIQDMVSGYYYLRTLDYSKYKVGDTISVDGFFDKEVYPFRVRLAGREQLRTKIGKFNTIVLIPLMPENSLFDGEDSIQVWLSDDKNKIPLKVKAKMFIGAVEIDIKAQSGSRNEIKKIR